MCKRKLCCTLAIKYYQRKRLWINRDNILILFSNAWRIVNAKEIIISWGQNI